MSKGSKPKLIINTTKTPEGKVFDSFINEINKYSITPTTFKSRYLNEINNPVFQELYQYEGNTVNRFGLNVNSDTLKNEVTDYNSRKSIENKRLFRISWGVVIK
jgi:fido (protein-threonine AMPylation protein)